MDIIKMLRTNILLLLLLWKLDTVKGQIEMVMSLSYRDCTQLCKDRTDSYSAKYYRLLSMCKLFEEKFNSTPHDNERGVTKYLKAANMPTEETTVEEFEGSDKVRQPKGCGDPAIVNGAKVYGNMRRESSRVKYVCENSGIHARSTCVDGQWTGVDIDCTICASIPEFDPEQGDIKATTKRFNGTHNMAVLTCADETLELRQLNTPVCEIATGLWYNLDTVCCDMMHQGAWTKVHNWHTKTNYAWHSWFGFIIKPQVNKSADVGPVCFYRNSTALLNWEQLGVQRVRLDVVRDNQVVATITFNGNGTNHKGWFNIENVLESSFVGLDKLDKHDFDDGAFQPWKSGFKYFIADKFHGENATCTSARGWLVVTKKTFPCDKDDIDGNVILYTRSNKAVAFTLQEMDIADRLEMWIDN